MARALRIDIEGGWYHVTARGNERRAIFRDDRDRAHFLELLEEMVERHGVRLHGFVLMDNHYHLLVETPRANLSAAMQWLGVSYSGWFNRRHRRAGHLFQGRFKAVVLEESAWLEVSRYVHLNPVRVRRLGLDKRQQEVIRAGMATERDEAMVRRRVEALRGYRWSSYRGYAGLGSVPKWLSCEAVLDRVAGPAGKARQTYRVYVEDAVREGLEESPWERLEAGLVLGGREFVEKVRKGMRGDRREQPAMRKLEEKETPSFERVVATVEKVKGEKWAVFRDRHDDWGRDLVLYLARRRCGMKLGELARAAGGISYTSVAMAVKRFERRAKEEKEVWEVLRRTESAICEM